MSKLTNSQVNRLNRWARNLNISVDELTLRIVSAALDGDKYIEKAPADVDPYERTQRAAPGRKVA